MRRPAAVLFHFTDLTTALRCNCDPRDVVSSPSSTALPSANPRTMGRTLLANGTRRRDRRPLVAFTPTPSGWERRTSKPGIGTGLLQDSVAVGLGRRARSPSDCLGGSATRPQGPDRRSGSLTEAVTLCCSPPSVGCGSLRRACAEVSPEAPVHRGDTDGRAYTRHHAGRGRGA